MFCFFYYSVSAYLHGGKCLLQLTTNGFTFAAFVGHKVTCRTGWVSLQSLVWLCGEKIYMTESLQRFLHFERVTSLNSTWVIDHSSRTNINKQRPRCRGEDFTLLNLTNILAPKIFNPTIILLKSTPQMIQFNGNICIMN